MPEIEPARVAVIAVHGVGDHPPFETVKLIGDLLECLRDEPGGTPRYIPFTEVIKRVGVRPVKISQGTHEKSMNWKKPQPNTWGPMDSILQDATASPDKRRSIDYSANLDHLFMEGQLAEFRQDKPEDTYEMLRLEGKRIGSKAVSQTAERAAGGDPVALNAAEINAPEGDPKVNPPGSAATNAEQMVHVYEMYWADLSRLGTAFTQIFGELFQVMFHLSIVGVNNVKAAAINFHDGPARRPWGIFDFAQSTAAAVLAWPIPILNLFIAAFVPAILIVSLMRTKLSVLNEFIALVAVGALLFITAAGFWLMRRGRFSFAAFIVPASIVPGLGVAASLWGYFNAGLLARDSIEVATGLVLAAFGFLLIAMVIRAYNRQRPGSATAARYIGLVLIACLIGAWMGGRLTGLSSNYIALGLAFNAIEVCFYLLTASWLLFLAGMIFSCVAGWWAVRAIRPKSQADSEAKMRFDRARRTRWTSRLLLALPSLAFLLISLAGWVGIIKVARPLLPGEANIPSAVKPSQYPCFPVSRTVEAPCGKSAVAPMLYEPMMRLPGRAAGPQWAGEWVDVVMNDAGLTVFPVLLGATFLAMLITAWSIIPAVRDEITPPHGTDAELLKRRSRGLGIWLSHGFRFMHLAGIVLYLAMIGFLAVLPLPHPTNSGLMEAIGVIVAGAAVGIFGFGGRLSRIALGFRPVVRVMLDVDNWLREHPRDANPTAMICARYVSVLRHVLAWKDEKGGYDAIVIIAHSQGTVITSDLFRFLKTETDEARKKGVEYDPELAALWTKVPVYLFTMGCPLRQLYGLRFPWLYGYARALDAEHEGPHRHPDLETHLAPDPGALGVEAWYNAFRSGDYIGRNLWRADRASYVWDPSIRAGQEQWDPPAGKPKNVSMDKDGKRVEFCIGPGAHTHYWDYTAMPIAEMLDLLIRDCRKR